MGGSSRLGVILILLIVSLPFVHAVTLQYDSNGNVINDGEFSYEYNNANQLHKILENNNLIEEYFYDESGERIKKKDYETGEVTHYIGDYVKSSTGREEIHHYANGKKLAQTTNGVTEYYHPDLLGSTILITDSNGDVVEETEYLPFGTVTFGGSDRHLFTGQEGDFHGLEYYGARYYSPELRRFTQPDSVIPDLYNSQDLNRYTYVRNNPVKYTDPSGNFGTLATAGLGALIGGAISGTISYSMGGSFWEDAAVGAAAGFFSGLTLGAASLAGASTLSASAEVGIGAASSMVSGRAAKVTQNVIQGDSWNDDLFNPASIAIDGTIGVATAGAGRYVRNKWMVKQWDKGNKNTPLENLDDHHSRRNPAGFNKFKFTKEGVKMQKNLGKSDFNSKPTGVGEFDPYYKKIQNPSTDTTKYSFSNGRPTPGYQVKNPSNKEFVVFDNSGKLYSYHSPQR
jgi:RHS repeat-associated protein